MIFKRSSASREPPAADALTARAVGIGMNFAADGEAHADIEGARVDASVVGMERLDLRARAVHTTWLGVQHARVNAYRLVRLVKASESPRVRAHWAAVASGMPFASTAMWCFEPSLTRTEALSTLTRSQSVPIDRALAPELVEQHLVQRGPHAGRLPIAEATPACHARAGGVHGMVTRSTCWRVRGLRGFDARCACARREFVARCLGDVAIDTPMRSSTSISVFGVGSVLFALGCRSSEPNDDPTFGVVAQASLIEPVLNEILVNPPSTDTPFEFIELRGPAGLDLSGYTVAYLEGDANSNVGKALGVWALSGTIGSNGLFVVRDPAGHAVPSGTGVLDIVGFPASAQAGDAGTLGQMQNDAGTFLLVRGAPLAINATYGVAAGTLSLPVGAVVLDAVSITARSANEVAYGPLVTVASGTPDAVSRFLDDTTANSAVAWYGGDIVSASGGAAVQSDVTYSSTARSAVMPASARITPGAPNLTRPLAVDAGTPTLDAETPTLDAGTPTVDSGAAADAGTPPVDASLPVDAAADAGSVQDASASVDASYPPTASDPYLYEIVVNPPGDDFPYEYIEIKGNPGASLAGFSVAYVDGDAANIGVAKKVWALSGSIGANGFFVLKAPAGAGHVVPADTTIQGVSDFATSSQLENGAGTLVLYRGGTLTASTDYDANNDGTLELPSGVVVVDSVATTDDGSGFVVHGPLVTLSNGQPDAVSRLVGSTGRSSAAAWYGGDLLGTNASVIYDPAKVSPNTPAGAVLTPGAENAQGSPAPVDAGAPVVDAGPTDAGTPVVDAGPRDAGTPTVDAGGDAGTPTVDAGARDAGTPVADAGARDAGSLPAEQTFGEGEGGCGCAVVGSERRSTQPFAWVALGGFAMLVARRRRR